MVGATGIEPVTPPVWRSDRVRAMALWSPAKSSITKAPLYGLCTIKGAAVRFARATAPSVAPLVH